MAKGRILYEDYVQRYGTVTAGSAATSAPAANLRDSQLAVKWRSQTGTNSTYVLADLGAQRSIDAVGLIATNLTAAATRRVRISTTDSTGAAGDAHDSGTGSAGVDPLYSTMLRLLPSPVTGRYVRIDITDASLQYLEAGRFLVGLCWRPTYNYRLGWTAQAVDDAQVATTWGGADWRDGRAVRRRIRAELLLTRAEFDTHGQAILRLGGSRDVLFVLDPDSSNLGRDSIFGRIAPVELRNPYPAVFATTLDITERLA